MAIPLTPHHVAAVYDCLRVMPPFNRWHLPAGDEVEFRVTRARLYYGMALVHRQKATIWVSSKNVGHFNTLAHVIAHEMTHLYQLYSGTHQRRITHNAEFRALMAEVCLIHGWDGAMI